MVEKESALRERIELYVARNGKILAIAGIVIGVFLSISAVTLGTPMSTVTEAETVNEIKVTQQSNAVVTNNTSLFRRGETLTNREIYPLEAAPNFTINLVVTSSKKPINTTLNWKTIVYSTQEKNSILWKEMKTLDQGEGNSVELSANENILSISRFEEKLRKQYGPEISIKHEVVVKGTTDNSKKNQELQSSGKFKLYRATYSAPDLSTRKIIEEHSTVTSIDRSSVYTIMGSNINKHTIIFLGIGTLSFLISGVLYYVHDKIDEEEAELNLVKSRYEVYITEVEGPITCGKPDEKAKSLKELLDCAINTNNQVIYGSISGIYYIQNKDKTIVYDPTGRYSTFDEFEIAFGDETPINQAEQPSGFEGSEG